MNFNPILSLSFVFILSFFFARLARKIKVPTITAYVLLGILLSPNVSNILADDFLNATDFFSNIVLGMIAFALGESFAFSTLRRVGRTVMGISISASLIPWFLVTSVLWLVLGQPFYSALVFGAIAAATAPAAVVMVTQEYKSKGEFTDVLLGVVAIDDAWALIIFGFSLSLVKSFMHGAADMTAVVVDLLKTVLEIFGSFLIALLVSWIFNKLSALVVNQKDRVIFTFGFLFLVIGVSIYLQLSVLLSCMFFGAILVNSNRDSIQYFTAIQELSNPLYLIFFVLAGAHLRFDVLGTSIGVTIAYILLRTVGKILGAFIGARWVKAPKAFERYMGFALIPQAGVALACALVAKHAVGGVFGDMILSVTIASTVIFELFGPWVTKYSLEKAKDIPKSEA
jgi:Kef-type K+ transport system membrane component KefB